MKTSESTRQYIDAQYEQYPELFPTEMQGGYKLNGWTAESQKMPGNRMRRIRMRVADKEGCKASYTVTACDTLPYNTGMVHDVEKALFLKRFGVPDWALTHVFGRNDSYWYRQTEALGRYNLVGSTVKQRERMPEHVLADEKHAKAHGQKWYIATTVAEDCVLGASVSVTADTTGLEAAYGVFKQEAQAVQPGYKPKTVNTDGWAATGRAWLNLFPTIVVIRCFLHAFIKIRSCCKRLKTKYDEIKQQVWEIYRTENRTDFMLGIGALQQWVMENRRGLPASATGSIDKLIQRAEQYCLTFEHPEAYRTSNMLDRHMEPMARWLTGGRHFHGNLQAAELRVRAWALLHNYWPYCPRAKISDSYRSPAHKLNQFMYRENWLENLLVASSSQGFRVSHRKRLN